MILEAKNIKKEYRQQSSRITVLKGIDLSVDEGEIISIVGPSGVGKSTLLHILGGLDKPTEGSVMLSGEDLYSRSDTQLAKIRNSAFGFIFQFYHLLPEFTVLENVMLPKLIANKSTQVEAKAIAEDFIVQVGLQHRIKHKPYELSGGEQQRTAIARALVNEPSIIFCDEPTGNLDSKSGSEIIDLLLTLNQRNKQTFIIVTHDDSIAQLTHRTIHMCDGSLLNEESRKARVL